MRVLTSLLLAASAAAAPSDPGAEALGAWTVNGATVDIKREDGKLVGRLLGDPGPCPLKAGAEVLRGTQIDDSLAAHVHLCLLDKTCGSEAGEGLAILLVTKQLTGGVHTQAACAQSVKSLVFRRPGQGPVAMTAPAPTERLSHTPVPKNSGRAGPSIKGPAEPSQPRTSIALATATPQQIAPNSPLAPTTATAKNDAPVGTIPGHPVGGPHAEGYDPRDARLPNTPQGEAERMLRRGLSQLEAGQFERARKTFHEALAKDPQRPEAYNGVGVTFYARGDLDEALAWYKRALEADPRFGDAFYNMACAYALQGHNDLAFRYLKLAALNHYSERAQMEKDDDLRGLRNAPEWREILDQMSGSEAKRSGAGTGTP